ncbi:RHS repeat-associated core domain-containing protein [Allorhizocola rhizosphaerae]|uniref:RHS repeat-associated core domain-containing protein n=1 Tax=Allorhizocola rhizosphaerae TaxID=1872709 RepID=UPI001B8B4FB9|nr:RHS repeat-associated core domain-containing protein [Allorhizocola rhizosphaerae]
MWLDAADDTAKVEVLDRASAQKSGVDGLLLKVSGKARLKVDYSGFEHAYGADWGTRLRLVTVPDGVPLGSRNDVAAKTVSADVADTGLVALAAAPEGPAGSYAASSLQPSSTWEVGGSSGDFSWSYPMRVPPSLGGPKPAVGLSYSSSSVDGRMAASNNQPSWVGEGFEYWPGFIERRYRACKFDGGNGASAGTRSGDLCWATDNAVLSLNGKGAELLRGSDGRWHPRSEDGSRIERRTGGVNGDKDGEHWVVTTPDGVQYWFGHNRLPGWAAGKAETNSTWTVPVYGNGSSEPCNSEPEHWCQQAWRWNLDYVVDPQGNTISYWYAKETNSYSRNMSGSSLTSYVRGGYLERIDYGTRSSTAYGTAPMQVHLIEDNRCLTNCTNKNATTWPDTPWDLECTSSSCLVGSPTFWSGKRLSKVVTKLWAGTGTSYRDVESWTLTHSFPSPGDGTRAGLFLDKIGHTGHVGTNTSVPDITFTGTQKPNRVDAADHSPAMNWWRLAHIVTESGNSISITYSGQDCVRGTRMPSAPHSNMLRCYPVRWTPEGYTDPVIDYFHKYIVTAVTETDMALPVAGRSPRTVTKYEYPEAPAWHYTDDDGLIDKRDKTWSVWRGYERVRVISGDPAEQTVSETRYFRGMHGDKLPSGTRSISIQGLEGPAIADEEAYVGLPRETVTYNGANVAQATLYDPWQGGVTASRTIDGSTVQSRFAKVTAQYDRVALDGGRGWRRTTTRTTFDPYGMKTAEENLGDDAVTGDEKCTLTTYEPRNTGAWLMSYPQSVQETAVDCATAGAGGLTADEIIKYQRVSYDQQAAGVAPAKGSKSRVEELSALPNTYVTTFQATHDANGREVSTTDVRGNRISTAFTQPGGGAVTGITTTNHLSWVTATTVEPAWGHETLEVDPNGKRTEQAYDGLGRLTSVWLPGRARTETANFLYQYALRRDAASSVTTSVLNASGGYTVSHTLYDAHLRVRQTQAPDVPAEGAAQGRIMTDTFYDTAGRKAKTNERFVADGVPSANLFLPLPDAQIPAQKRFTYDGLGRLSAEIVLLKGTEFTRATVGHGGDRTYHTPPAGGTATTRILDAQGRNVALRQHHGATPIGAYDETKYGYDRKGQLRTVTDPAGNVWTYGYDLRGRQTSTDDPDKGLITTVYNNAGDVVSTTDARGEVLFREYDSLGRKVATRDDNAGGFKRAEWTYDTLAKGKLTKSTRYVGTDAYVTEVTGYTDTYQSKGTRVTIPASQPGLNGSHTVSHTFKADGSVATTQLPTLGNLPAETLIHGYGANGAPTTLSTSLSSTGEDVFLINGTTHTRQGELALLGRRYDGGQSVETAYYYEEGTRRLARGLSVRDVNPAVVADLNYGYDKVGNITRVAEASTSDNQCFSHDYLRRLTHAWTPANGDCNAARSTAALGGPAKYWQSFSYDAIGNRLTYTDHVNGQTTNYQHPAAGGDRPHTVTSAQTGSSTATYTYDEAGNTKTRPTAGAGTQTLTWDAEGRLASSVDSAGTTSYIYDADGNRLIRVDPGGRTLYLGDQELRSTGNGAGRTGTRYYSHAGQRIGVRTASGLTWLINDHQGTAVASVAAVGQAVTLRRHTPFGTARGSTSAWVGDRGFVGGTNDNTGLVHLGAREYDSALGRFISVDPVMALGDPQQWHGYSYANSTPVTLSDPTGMIPDDCARPDIDCDDYVVGCPKCNEENKKKNPCWPTSCNVRDPDTFIGPPAPGVCDRDPRWCNRSKPKPRFTPFHDLGPCAPWRPPCKAPPSLTPLEPTPENCRLLEIPGCPPPKKDNGGGGMLAICGGFNAQLGGAGSWGVCIGIDSNGIGAYHGTKVGMGPGIGAGMSLGAYVSNGGVRDQTGDSTYAQGGVEQPIGAVGSLSKSATANVWTAGVDASVGPGISFGEAGVSRNWEAWYFEW